MNIYHVGENTIVVLGSQWPAFLIVPGLFAALILLLIGWAFYRAGMAYGERRTYNKMLDSGAWKPSARRRREDAEYWPRPTL